MDGFSIPYCTKYEFHLTAEYKIIPEYSCEVSLTTTPFVDSYYPNEQMYQI